MTLPTAAVSSSSGASKATITPSTAAQYINIPTGYNGTASYYKINAIPSNYIIPSGNKEITSNGNGIDVTNYATVTVNVPTGSTINNQNKTVTPSKNQQSITADNGYTGLGTVTISGDNDLIASNIKSGVEIFGVTGTYTDNNINLLITPNTQQQIFNASAPYTGYKTITVNPIPGEYIIPSGNKAITENGSGIDVTNYATVSVNVPTSAPSLQQKSINPSESIQTVTPDTGYYLDEVTVGAISSTYIGSGITQRSSSDLTASGATVTAPAGYYATSATKSVAAGSVTGPTSLSGTSATISTGANTVTFTKTGVTTTPTVSAGYISGATSSTATVTLTADITPRTSSSVTTSGATVTIPAGYYASQVQKTISNGSATAPSSISGTSATVSHSGTTLTLSKTVSVTPTVSAGYISSGTAGNSNVSLSATDANFVASNIKSGVSIFGLTGSYEGSGGSGGESKNVQVAQSTTRATSSSYTELISLTCTKAGTYDVYWSTARTSTSGTWGSQLYLGSTAYGSAQTGSWSNNIQNIHLTNVQITANQKVSVRARTRGSNYYAYVGTLVIIEN